MAGRWACRAVITSSMAPAQCARWFDRESHAAILAGGPRRGQDLLPKLRYALSTPIRIVELLYGRARPAPAKKGRLGRAAPGCIANARDSGQGSPNQGLSGQKRLIGLARTLLLKLEIASRRIVVAVTLKTFSDRLDGALLSVVHADNVAGGEIHQQIVAHGGKSIPWAGGSGTHGLPSFEGELERPRRRNAGTGQECDAQQSRVHHRDEW